MKRTRTRHQRGSLTREGRKQGAVWIYRWSEKRADGTRHNRKVIVGSIRELKTETLAWAEVNKLCLDINRPRTGPRIVTFEAMVDHYRQHELRCEEGSKAESTRDVYDTFLDAYILPKWKKASIREMQTSQIESWMKTLKSVGESSAPRPLAAGTRSKVRNILSAVFNHGIRWNITPSNPITGPVRGSGVRQSAKRVRTPDVLSMVEVRNLLAELQEPSRTLVHLLAVTGLRISEARGLKWRDIDFAEGTAKIERGAVGHFISECKNKASRKPVPLAPQLLSTLRGLLCSTEYKRPDDWLFPSLKSNGKAPLWPKSLLEDYVRPAAERASIRKHLTWHVFRHSFATQLKANGADVKVVQESLRHASSKITLDVYTQAIPSDVRNAQLKIADEITGMDDQENAIVPESFPTFREETVSY